MPFLAAIEVLEIIPEIADIVAYVGQWGAVAGSLASGGALGDRCYGNKCIKVKRDLLGLENVPKLNVGRDGIVGLCNVPQYNFDICRNELQGVTVMSSIPSAGVARFDNVPPACMDLAVVLSGSCNGNNVAVTPCGSACIEYGGLSNAQLGSLEISLGFNPSV